MLDQKDRDILTALDFHARKGATELGAQLGLSKQVVEYRINSLLKREILEGFYPIIDSYRVGYAYGRVLLQCSSVSAELEQKLKRYAQKHSQVLWAYALRGPYDFLLVYWVRNAAQFRDFIDQLLLQFGEHLRQCNEQMVTCVEHLSHRCFDPKATRHTFDLKESGEFLELDLLDRRLLAALSQDGRASFATLGRSLKESEKVVRYRLQRLEQRKIIAGYRPIINYERAGFSYLKVFLQLDLAQRRQLQALRQYLRDHEFVLYLVEGIALPGDVDFELVVPDQEHFFAFMDQLRQRFPKLISSYQQLTFAALLKINYFPFG